MNRSNIAYLVAFCIISATACGSEQSAETDGTIRCARQTFARYWPAELRSASCALPPIVRLDRAAVGASCDLGAALGCQENGEIMIADDLADGSGQEGFASVLAHESAHWLLACSGLRADGDPFHQISNVWEPGGIVDQVRACTLDTVR